MLKTAELRGAVDDPTPYSCSLARSRESRSSCRVQRFPLFEARCRFSTTNWLRSEKSAISAAFWHVRRPNELRVLRREAAAEAPLDERGLLGAGGALWRFHPGRFVGADGPAQPRGLSGTTAVSRSEASFQDGRRRHLGQGYGRELHDNNGSPWRAGARTNKTEAVVTCAADHGAMACCGVSLRMKTSRP